MVTPKISFLFSAVVFLFLSACSENIDFQGHNPQQYRSAYPMENKVVTSHALINLEFNGASKTLSAKDSDYLHDSLSKINPHAVDDVTLRVAAGIAYKSQRMQHIKNILHKSGYILPVSYTHLTLPTNREV